jgi:autotransporter-associated beta strand protein
MGWVAYRFAWAALALARRAWRRALAAFILLLLIAASHPAAAQNQVQVNQNFISQGPGPEQGNYNWIGGADKSPNGTDAGAVQAVLLDPALGAGTIFAASPNGGIWMTTNNGATWSPVSSNQASLSIASLSLDLTDSTGKTIIAGVGMVDNGEYSQNNLFNGRSGALTGLLYTANGGQTWSALGQNSAFAGESVVSAMARGSTILVATFEPTLPQSATAGYGLFLSTNGGTTFKDMSGAAGSGLPAGAVTSLVADPSDPSTFYAAVKSGANKGATAVYVSHDLGATWTAMFTAANSNGTISSTGDQTVITLAAGPNGSVAVAVSDLGHAGSMGVSKQAPSLVGLFLSSNQGTTWNQLTSAPNVVAGGQTPINLHIAIDPTNQNIVYLTGDAYQTCPCSVEAFRLNYNPATNTSTATTLTFGGTPASNLQDANTVHADSRSISFDSAGDLILSTDGGIYMRTNPQGNGTWEGLNGNLSVFEGYAIAYDANSKRVGIAAQDNGVSLQSAPGNALFNTLNGGDGTNIAINDRTLTGMSAVYSSSEDLSSLSRLIINAQGQVVAPLPYDPVNSPGGVSVYCTDATHMSAAFCADLVNANSTFSAQFVLNRINPSLIAISGATDIYTTQDTLSGSNGINASSVNLFLTDLGTTGGPSVISYGTANDIRAIAVGAGVNTGVGEVWFSANNTAGSLTQLTNYIGGTPTGIVFDNRTEERIFVADGSDLYYTRNADGAATFAKLTTNLPQGFVRPTSVEFISNNGVNALLIGGMNTPLSCTSAPNGCVISLTQSPITVADSDSGGTLSNWRAFGQGLPNALVYQMVYNPTVDVLAVSGIGVGAYVLYDVTSYFPQATVLQLGLANNDSMPDASYLTNGTVGVRPLIKYGTGTLTIAGDATYAGGTTINGGTIVLGTGGSSGSVIGNIAFCSNASDPNCDPSTDKFLVFNRADVYTYGGSISGPGQLIQAGPGTIILSGQSTYAGSTTVAAGILSVTGSITSDVIVNSGAALSGSGTVGNTTINAGGLLAPSNPGGALTVQGNLVFATAGAFLVEIAGNAADRVNVIASATLAGNLLVALTGSTVAKQYTILNATGGITGTFAGVNNLPAALTGNLGYDANNVFLNLSLNYNALGHLNSNQQNVADALSNFFNANGSIPVVYASLTPAALSQITGESATGSQQTTFQAMSQFIATLLDPFIGGRESSPASPSATPYAADNTSASAYADTRKTWSERERAAYNAVFTKAPLRQVYDPHWSVWAAGFGGSQTTDGNAAVGSNSVTSSIFGVVAGADYLLSPRTIAGFALAGGGTSFSAANAGSGRSDLFQAGAFVRHTAGNAYVSAVLAYGWQDITTNRTVTLAGLDQLQARFNANAFSGRVEGGYRFVSPWIAGIGITPYAAAQFTTFDLPAYAEQALIGTNNFALAYGAKSVTDPRSELGFRTDKSFAMPDGVLTLRGRLAWAHDYDTDRSIGATFQTLPGASFVVNGAAQASDSVLTTASIERKWTNNWSIAATFEGEFSNVTNSYAGKGVVRYTW